MSEAMKSCRGWSAIAVAAGVTAMSLSGGIARAASLFWDSGGGADRNWSNASNWDVDGSDQEPTPSDKAFLNNGGTIDIIEAGEIATAFIVGGTADTSLNPNNLGLGGTVNFASTGVLTTGPFIPSVDVGAGAMAPGGVAVWNHNGGTLNSGELFRIGADVGSVGTLNMNSGLIDVGSTKPTTATTLDFFLVGDNGKGTLNMNGGEIRSRHVIGMAFQPGSSATFTMSNGLIKGNDEFVIGRFGPVTATVTGGTIDSHFDVRVQQFETAESTLNVSGGLIRTDFQVVVAGATFQPTGGVAKGAKATVNLSGGTIDAGTRVLLSDSWLAQSTVNHTGGTFTAQEFLVGEFSDSTYNLSGNGILNADVQLNIGTFSPVERIGNAGQPPIPVGNFNQSGNTTVTTGGLLVAENGTANYTLNSGTVHVLGVTRPHNGNATQFPGNSAAFGNLIVGRNGGGNNMGNGHFIQNGGAVTVDTNVLLGDFDDSNGVYTLNGGTINVAGNFIVGGALASNAPPDATRVEPGPAPIGAQGQALNTHGRLEINGSAGVINVGGKFLANPADKSAFRNGPGQENHATLAFNLANSGVSRINVTGVGDLDGAVIDMGFLSDATFAPAFNQAFDLMTVASFGATGTGTTQNVGTGTNFALAAGDATDWLLRVISGGNGQILQAVNRVLPGDTDANLIVNFQDLVKLAQNYNQTTGRDRTTGDFNRDGATNFTDLVLLAQNYNKNFQGQLSELPQFTSASFQADWALAQSLVPEPTTLGLLGGAGMLLLGRRRTAK